VKVVGVVMECDVMSVWLYMHLSCPSMFICYFACVFMVMVMHA